MAVATVTTEFTNVFPRDLDRSYPLIDHASGVWLYDADGNAFLDAVGGGAMVASLGNGVPEIIAAANEQAKQVSFIYNQQFTSAPQEELAREVAGLLPPSLNRMHFVSGGAEANETALRMVRSYHVERGELERTRIISPAQAYHGPTVATLGLTGRAGLQYPYQPFVVQQPHIPPSTWRFDPSGQAALDALDAIVEAEGPERIAAFMCEAVSAAALPGYSPPPAFWEGLVERRERYGFLIVLDEVVTGFGRTGTWFAAHQLGFEPDIITSAKGLGAGYAPIGFMAAADHVYQAVADGSREFELGHTWDGAPLPCAVGLAVIRYLREHDLIARVREVGALLKQELAAALEDCPMVHEVRGRGLLLGIEYVDPRDGESFLDPQLGVARQIDNQALENGLIVYSTQPTRDGFAGDQTLLAPAFVTPEAELSMIVERMVATVRTVQERVVGALTAA